MDKLKELLDKTFGKKISKELYNPKLKSPKETFGYARGEIYTSSEFLALKDGDMVHLEYLEDGEICEDDFGKLSTNSGDTEEWNINGWPIPIDDLKEDRLVENIDNGDHVFTVRKVVYDGVTDYDRICQMRRIGVYIIEEMQEIFVLNNRTTDKEKKKELKLRHKELNKLLTKVIGI